MRVRTHARTHAVQICSEIERERTNEEGRSIKNEFKNIMDENRPKNSRDPKKHRKLRVCLFDEPTYLPTYLHLDKVASHSDNKIGTDFFFFCFGKQKRIKGAIWLHQAKMIFEISTSHFFLSNKIEKNSIFI